MVVKCGLLLSRKSMNCRCLRTDCYKKIFGCKKNKGNDKYILQIGDCNIRVVQALAILAEL